MKHPRKRIDERTARVRRLFASAGVKLTPQRLAILEEVAASRSHPTTEEVFRRVRPRMPTLSLDTVYRTLDRLEKMGLLCRVEVLDDQIRYDPVTDPHHHLVCVLCKQVQDFSWPSFDAMKSPSAASSWGRTVRRHVEIRGICASCAARGNA